MDPGRRLESSAETVLRASRHGAAKRLRREEPAWRCPTTGLWSEDPLRFSTMIGRTSSVMPRCGAAANMPDRACSPFSSAAQCGCTGRPAAAAAVFWRAVAAHGAQPTGLAHPWLRPTLRRSPPTVSVGIAAAIGLMLIGGRLVLSFTTTSWCQTVRVGCRADFARLDALALG